MKKNLIILFLFSAQTVFGVELFTINTSNNIVATKDSNNTIGLIINQIIYQEILDKEMINFNIQLPVIGGLLDIELQNFSCFS